MGFGKSPYPYLRGGSFEPLSSCSLHLLIILFLLSLATAKRVSKLQALSRHVAFWGPDMSLSYLPEFVAKTESLRNPLPRSFLVTSLQNFVGDMPEDCFLCPVRAIHLYIDSTLSLSPRPHSLFVSPSNPSRSLSTNALLFFLRRVILGSGSVVDSSMPRAHSIRGVATSAAFIRNWSVSKVLEASTWRSNPVFASLYLKDLAFAMDGFSSLGPFVAAGSVLL